MQKIKVRKDVYNQMASKLKNTENEVLNAGFAENMQKSDINSQNEQVTINLQASKNIFTRGDFDEYKISDEELKEHEIDSEDIEKGIRTVVVPPSNGKKGYQYQRDFPDKEDRKESIKQYEERKEKAKANLKNWATQENYDSAKGLTKEQIELRFGNEIKSLFIIPKKILKRFKGVHNDNAYCAKWYFMDHMVNHHPTIPVNDYHRIQYIVDNYTELYWDNKNKSLIIAKNYGNKIRDYVILHKEPNETFSFYKTYYNSKKKVPKKFKEIKKSVMEGLPYLHQSHLTMAAGGQNISGRHNNLNISQQNNLSSKNVTKSLTYSGHKLQGRTRLYGMDISIENKKGSYRSGTDKDGHKWRCYMNYDYGYIRGTVGTDKDHLDCYVGNDKNAQKVYIIHQNDPVTHKYDEDKCMLCFSSAADAKKAYMKQYDRPGFYGSMTIMTIDEFKSFIFSHQGKKIHKSFDIQITDITENNKQQKLEQFNKALNAIANNKPFVIKHIPSDNSKHYENLTVRLMDFDKSKIEKAVHKVALSLDADISGASKGEAFVYKSQEEIVDKYFKEFTNRTRAVYNFVISYFDLPDIRIVSKAGELKWKGKILYNPETGLPIKESEWKQFVVELEKFLNRNYTGIGEKIVLSAESLGIILDRLSKTNSLEAIRKMSVSDLKAKRYDVDWIGDSIKNMKDKFGDVISRERQARIQIACISAAQRVTKVEDDMRNNIQQIIIDGIRDKQSKSVVAQNLFDKCASLNRDMQRIADSEVQMASNSAYCKEEVYNSKPGEKVYFKRFEMIDDNTCKECKKLNGTIALWSDVPLPDEHIRDEYAKYAIWEGKNVGNCPIGICHPYCRGSWVRYYPDLD